MPLLVAAGLILFVVYLIELIASLPTWVWWAIGGAAFAALVIWLSLREANRRSRERRLMEQEEKRERQRKTPPRPGETLEDSIRRKFMDESLPGLDQLAERYLALEAKQYAHEPFQRLWGKTLAEYVEKHFWSRMSDAERDQIAPHLKAGDDRIVSVFEAKVRLRASYLKVAYRSTTMTPLEFEKWCARILEVAGWRSKETIATGDQGADVIAEKDGVRLVLQCKLYNAPVGNKAVQEVYAARAHYQAQFAAVVTNSSFTPSAKALASSTGVLLLHADDLVGIGRRLVRV